MLVEGGVGLRRRIATHTNRVRILIYSKVILLLVLATAVLQKSWKDKMPRLSGREDLSVLTWHRHGSFNSLLIEFVNWVQLLVFIWNKFTSKRSKQTCLHTCNDLFTIISLNFVWAFQLRRENGTKLLYHYNMFVLLSYANPRQYTENLTSLICGFHLRFNHYGYGLKSKDFN